MALVKYYECGKQISDKALNCPQCGAPALGPNVVGADEEVSFGYVYFIRNQELYKIGITQNFEQCMKQLKPDEVIIYKKG